MRLLRETRKGALPYGVPFRYYRALRVRSDCSPPILSTSPTPPILSTSPTPPILSTSPTPPILSTSPTPPILSTSPTPPILSTSPTPPILSTSPTPPKAWPGVAVLLLTFLSFILLPVSDHLQISKSYLSLVVSFFLVF
ncbi:Cell surface antigen I/II [Trichinella murrelli]|uniref:Cell surface antigen I/II n=1 Tax=Trichinella murrelli TaxID=144512 RepID=A0A0V0TPS9_9BILA|nr:Cell surface antigen I/II [Trichinella murrelli]